MKIVKEMPKSGRFLAVYIDQLDGEMETNQWKWEDGVLKDWDYQMEDYYPVIMSQYPDNLYYITVVDSEWNEDDERALFEKAYQIPSKVEFRKELYSGGRSGYAIFIKPLNGEGFWSTVNEAHHVQCNWETWVLCSKAHWELTK